MRSSTKPILARINGFAYLEFITHVKVLEVLVKQKEVWTGSGDRGLFLKTFGGMFSLNWACAWPP